MVVDRLIEILDSMMNQSSSGNCKVCFNNDKFVNRIYLDDDGFLCLVADEGDLQVLEAGYIKSVIEDFDEDHRVQFVLIDANREETYFKIKKSYELIKDVAHIDVVKL